MENASKALLIAAAVLIVVLLVAFGMRIFNSASSTGDAQQAADVISVGQFNAQFKAYTGTISHDAVERLINVVNTNNQLTLDNKNDRIVVIRMIDDATTRFIAPILAYTGEDNKEMTPKDLYKNAVNTLGHCHISDDDIFKSFKSFKVEFIYDMGNAYITGIHIEGNS